MLTAADFELLRPVAASMGMMLETTSDRLSARGGPHFGSPDKLPAARLETLRLAGEARVPFTTGILIGIGETREERIEALEAIAAAGPQVQEVIVQNFRAKAGTRMVDAPEPPLEELLWTIAVARLILPPEVALQAPPNLTEDFARLLDAGIDDWGGVSPVTIDHVNPEAPWPELDLLRAATESRGLELAPRLTVYSGHISARVDRRRRPPARAEGRRRPRTRPRGRLVARRDRRDPVRRAPRPAPACGGRRARRSRDRPPVPGPWRGAPARARGR